ncbi:LacI family DNA-binding transcriptional regulator [Marisediminicola senii]|uniref:LacI family DNA-binding transcriptional regulator n=1 Tax=Marisediminicola senii TaxID=2711233 RepID=UPI0013EC5E64|nr:LacI family DNA-binding transcriptional regulator [Marisediminicola senii]
MDPVTVGKPATIYDVARAAGVSHQTVSRYLRGYDGIRPQTRGRVEVAIKSLGYRPNLAARLLRSRTSTRIGALAHEMSEMGPARVVQGAYQAARRAGYVLDVVMLDGYDDKSISDAIDLLTEQQVAGIFATAQTDRVKAVLEQHPRNIPIFIDSRMLTTVDGRPSPNNEFAGRVAAEALLALGHRTMATVTGPMEWHVSRDRLDGFADALAIHGLTPAAVLEGDWSPRSGYEAGMLLPIDTGITGVFAANDHMALGVIRALGERGIRVPHDMSVVGVDDIPEAAFLTPSLSTVRLDFEAEGHYAMNCLIAEIEGRSTPVEDPPHPFLVERDSTRSR